MPPQIIEKFEWDELLSYTEPSLTLRWVVINTELASDVDTLVQATVPVFVSCAAGGTGASVDGDGVLWFQSYKKEHLGGVWPVEVQYAKDPPRKAGYLKFQADSGGEKVHLTQSLSTVNKWAIDANGNRIAAPDYKQAIGVNDDKVDGVDVPGKGFKFTVQILYGMQDIPHEYLGNVANWRGAMNNDTIYFVYKNQYLRFYAGELRLEDFHVTDPGQDLLEFSFTFAYSPNIVLADAVKYGGIPATGDTPASIVKLGWDYLWFAFARNSSTTRWLKRIVGVYVERVAVQIDFVNSFIAVFYRNPPDA